MRYFFTADTHFFHRNIIQYSERPFRDVHSMNQAMIAQWNALVGKEDRVYHLGDVSFGGLAETFRLLAELNGELCLVAGNHDDELIADPYLRERFHWIKPYHEERIEGHDVVMFHYPIAQWRGAQRGSWQLHGHTHGNVNISGAAMDVGIDAHPQFSLWSWSEIKARLCDVRALPYPRKAR
ncbi:metallophosphoesterase family protein [Suttonella sp. R2A3]|uniref:metallophosphoesterase family protein n=1 Tax=Suttonella sp. R2A3 TaxID=2908648 RepID=UPI001F382FE6|nr:metallophosphoesterase family protein [Suttonella sp. R2A3]UJF24351.1 metallophosphoesterase family protein [Suttonella sp. R2A3]